MKKALLLCTLFAAVSSANANVLISQNPWGSTSDNDAMNAVYGAAGYTTYNNYATATATNIFTAGNNFVFLEGGANTDTPLQNYLNANQSSIMTWVDQGGHLLIQSAGWDQNVAFNGVTLNQGNYSSTGALTAAGVSAFTGYGIGANSYSGNYLAHDIITGGTGLTSFMTGSAPGTILAGGSVGNGYIMYSGMTTSNFTNAAPVLENAISFTSGQAAAVPEPANVALMAAGLGIVGAIARRKKH